MIEADELPRLTGRVRLGWCKVCAVEDMMVKVNRRMKRGQTNTEIAGWSKSQPVSYTRNTLAKHRKHITDPHYTLVQRAQQRPVLNRVSSTEFLRTVVDIGAQRAMDNPEEVTIEHSLAAARILETKQADDQRGLQILVVALTGGIPTRPLQLTGGSDS